MVHDRLLYDGELSAGNRKYSSAWFWTCAAAQVALTLQ